MQGRDPPEQDTAQDLKYEPILPSYPSRSNESLALYFGECRIGIWRDADVAMPILPLLFMFEASPF